MKLLDLNDDALYLVLDLLRQPELRNLAATCNAAHDLASPYVYRRVKLDGIRKLLTFNDFIHSAGGARWRHTIRSLTVDVRRDFWSKDIDIYHNTQALARILRSAPNLVHLDLFEEGTWLTNALYLADALVHGMPNLISLSLSVSEAALRLLHRLRQPLRRVRLDERTPWIPPRTPSSDARTLIELACLSSTLTAITIDLSCLTCSPLPTFPHVRSLSVSAKFPHTSVDWTLVRRAFPDLRELAVEGYHPTRASELEEHLQQQQLSQDSSQIPWLMVFQGSWEGFTQIRGLGHIEELHLTTVPSSDALVEAMEKLSPTLLSLDAPLLEWPKDTLSKLIDAVPTLKCVCVDTLAEKNHDSLVQELDLLRDTDVALLHVQCSKSRWEAAVASSYPDAVDAFECYAATVRRSVPRLRRLALSIEGLDKHGPVAWQSDPDSEVRRPSSAASFRRIPDKEGQAWRADLMQQFSPLAQRHTQHLELFLGPRRPSTGA
ncbi:hypothetical protein PUNSTDRAFT_115728 [Punctularia strigosozonata HHB-11173 SS5]|uniref:uncharacterized protein n=1 Tax=Punctularia strigosozonata (strain HHB-11173) TaxID=741275 RepID=UPI0004417504|nr:uncharacterized protein PUNSTDRAFT_115728 [Punctularia strigosozonata HHB-11173 SS5]EIN05817.1 hypothetical protein PUNSTDRAFT_115728 [Punctularia strigosozonata HHB-11173 SS5]